MDFSGGSSENFQKAVERIFVHFVKTVDNANPPVSIRRTELENDFMRLIVNGNIGSELVRVTVMHAQAQTNPDAPAINQAHGGVGFWQGCCTGVSQAFSTANVAPPDTQSSPCQSLNAAQQPAMV